MVRSTVANTSLETLGKTGTFWVIFFLVVGVMMVGIVPGINIPYSISSMWGVRLLWIGAIFYLVALNPNQLNFMIAVILAMVYIGALVPNSLYEIEEGFEWKFNWNMSIPPKKKRSMIQ